MKTARPLLLSLCLALNLHAQTSELLALSSAPTIPATAPTERTPETLDTLLGPIALYPDALVALILPAATTPSDVVLADRYAQAKGDPAAVAAQPWDDSIKTLVRYPDVLKWMDDNLPWTQSLGQAYLDQPADVMNAVQRLRARAQISGALINTPQQHVLTSGNIIIIVPAQPEIIYVPVYDPQIVYVQRTVWVSHPLLLFGIGYAFGPWSGYDCDWDSRNIRVISRPHGWQNHPRSWNHAGIPSVIQPSHPWQPTVQRPRQQQPLNTQSVSVNSQQTPDFHFLPAPFSNSNSSPGMRPSTPKRPAHPLVDRSSLVPPAASGIIIAPTVPVITPKPAQTAFSPTQTSTLPAPIHHPPSAAPSSRPIISPTMAATSVAQPATPPQAVRSSSHWNPPSQGRTDYPVKIQGD